MNDRKPIFTRETFQFFRDLRKNNKKAWMDRNRERYQRAVVQPFRLLLEELTPAILELDERFDVSGRTGRNFSRINRDIRFAKDKTPYKAQMYLKFELPSLGDREGGQLYVGLTEAVVTVGFRVYAGAKRRDSVLARVAEPRVAEHPNWVAEQRKRLGKRFESYWYRTEKGEWTKQEGWPTETETWKRILAWIVRQKLPPAAATERKFPDRVAQVFRELYPLLKFSSVAD